MSATSPSHTVVVASTRSGPSENIHATCAEVRRSARQTGASIAVFVKNPGQPNEDRALAYGCGALAYGRMDTLEPDYERRTWRLYDELHRTRTAAVLWGVKRDYCGYTRWRVEQCKELQPGVVAVTFKRQSLLVLLSSLEIPGPAVRARLPAQDRPGRDRLRRPAEAVAAQLVTGPPPADPNMAKALVDAAFGQACSTPDRTAASETSRESRHSPNRSQTRRGARARPRTTCRTCSSSTPARRSSRSTLLRAARGIRRVNVDRARRVRGGLLGRHPGHVLPRHVRLRPRPVLARDARPSRAWTTVKRGK